MENPFLIAIQNKVTNWRSKGYHGIKKETDNILNHIKKVGFLHKPQVKALETYIYLKEILNNKPSFEIVKKIFDNEKDLISSLGLSKEQAYELVFDKNKEEKINKRIQEQYNGIDYANQVYALTMGAGKTILMGTMMLYDFVLSSYHKNDNRFAKNVLVFAPDTTIIESLKEIKSFDYTKVLPREYQSIVLNIKYHYLESTETSLTPIGNYNVVVSNSQKIILKTRHKEDKQTALFRNETLLKNRTVENKRLQAIRELNDLIVFVDEAHHSFGTTLEGSLKKQRKQLTIFTEREKHRLLALPISLERHT
ncbi:MAG: DEAD/DEAH box helicase family protein [bacterium]|nr:DEAD/DEAH box helicase family protein [bacterium]